MTSTVHDVVKRIQALMQESDKWPRMKRRYYDDWNEDHRKPCVIVFGNSGRVERSGQGWEMEPIMLKVWFVEMTKKRTKTKALYQDYEILRALLHTQSRLGNLENCQKGVVVGFDQRFGSRGNYIIDIMEVTVEVRLFKTY